MWAAFIELGTCRQSGMGLGPIPWTAIRDYAEHAGVDDLEQFTELIRALDYELLTIVRRDG